jgi:hypothetical protein
MDFSGWTRNPDDTGPPTRLRPGFRQAKSSAMRRVICAGRLSLLVAICAIPGFGAFAEDIVPITPAEAAKKINEKVVVEMEVKSTGGRENHYLNSEVDYKDAKNFTIFISKDHLEKFRKAGIEDPAEHFAGKTLQVTGMVVLEQKKPWIKVEDPDRIKVISKDKQKK